MKRCKISIITPYYKGQQTIFSTLDSIFKAANKVKSLDIEPIVIIDSMEDKEYIKDRLYEIYNGKIIIIENKENIGVANSRNRASKLATGDYIVFLDQDDNLYETYFLKVLEKIMSNPDLIITNGYICNQVNGKKTPLYYIHPKLKRKTLLRANKISTPGQVVFLRKIADMDNLFAGCSEDFKGADDWAAYVNIYINNPDLKVSYVHEKIFQYNLHGNNYSNNWEELNNSAIETSNFFLDKVKNEEKKILKKRIAILDFENKFKTLNKKEKLSLKNIIGLIDYVFFHIVYLNRIIGCAHKKIIRFYK